MSTTLVLSQGLRSDHLSQLADLTSRLSGNPLISLPFTASTLLLSAPEIRALDLVQDAAPGHILIHDYQSLDFVAPLPLDQPLTITADMAAKPGATELRVAIQNGPALRTALRQIPHDDLRAAKPLRLRPTDIADPDAMSVTCTQDDVDAFLDLSGDPNPIHRASPLIQDLRLPAPIVPGLLLLALTQPGIDAARDMAAIAHLRARFAAPVYVGDAFDIALQSRGTGKLRAIVHQNGCANAIVDVTLTA